MSVFPIRLFLVWFAGTCLCAAEDELPLPRWTEEELRAFRDAGGHPHIEPLLPEVPAYLGRADGLLHAGPRLDDLPTELSGEISARLRVEDLRRFLPDGPVKPGGAEHAVPTAFATLEELGPEFLLAACEASRTEYLIDPDVLVPEMAHLQILRLLEFHARDARIRLHILVIPRHAKLPAEPNVEKIASGSLARDESCLLVYPLGEPWRARLFLSRSVFDQTSTRFLTETAGACLGRSLESSDPFDQLHGYGVELSTRLFWLQKALGKKNSSAGRPQTLAEFSSAAGTSTVASPDDNMRSGLWQFAIWILPGVLAILLFGWKSRHWQGWKHRQACRRMWLLPDIEPKARLGGEFTGGGGFEI